MRRGIIYVAWGDKWLNEAVRSAASAAEMGYQTCLLTEPSEWLSHWEKHFDYVKAVDFSQFDGMHYFMKKWQCLLETPFDQTCFLDTDTKVMDSLDLGFDLAEQFGLCMTLSPGMMFHYQGKEYLHYNGGIMFFNGKRPDLVEQFVEVGKELQQECPGLVGDEPVFSVAFRRYNINPCVLPSVFNTIRAGQIHTRKIKVFHSRWHHATHLVSDQFGNDFTHEKRD
jgi:hypothetical protein